MFKFGILCSKSGSYIKIQDIMCKFEILCSNSGSYVQIRDLMFKSGILGSNSRSHVQIRDLMFYSFELRYNTADSTQTICWAEGEGTNDHITVTRWLEKFCVCCKKLDDQTRADRPKNLDLEASLQDRVGNPASSTWRVSGKFYVSQSNLVCHLHKSMYLSTPLHGPNVIQGEFLSRNKQIWIQSFPSLKLAAEPRLKNLVSPTVYS